MSRGFTLIEILVSLMIMLVLFTSVTPSWRNFYQNYQMKALAAGFHDFFSTVRSEAVFRNKDLWIYFEVTSQEDNYGWRISAFELELSESDSQVPEQNAISIRRGQALSISANWKKIKINGVNGRPGQSGHILFSMDGVKWLKLIFHNVTGRVRTCSVDGAYFGYLEC